MQISIITHVRDTRTPAAGVYKLLVKELVSICAFYLMGTAAAMGSGSGGGGGGGGGVNRSPGPNPVQKKGGDSALKSYKAGVHLLRAPEVAPAPANVPEAHRPFPQLPHWQHN